METALSISSALVVLVLVLPAVIVLGALARQFGAAAAVGGGPVIGRVRLDCPVYRKGADVEFLVERDSGRAADVLSCSVFSKPYHVRCDKGCLPGRGA